MRSIEFYNLAYVADTVIKNPSQATSEIEEEKEFNRSEKYIRVLDLLGLVAMDDDGIPRSRESIIDAALGLVYDEDVYATVGFALATAGDGWLRRLIGPKTLEQDELARRLEAWKKS